MGWSEKVFLNQDNARHFIRPVWLKRQHRDQLAASSAPSRSPPLLKRLIPPPNFYLMQRFGLASSKSPATGSFNLMQLGGRDTNQVVIDIVLEHS